jgi:capsule polysaccharide export protein KpsE/RkpR
VNSWRCVKDIQEECTASLVVVVVVVVVVIYYTCKTSDPYFSKKKLIRNEQSGVQLFNTVTNTAKYKTP